MTDVVAAASAGVLGTMYANARTHFSKDVHQIGSVLVSLIK